MRPQGLPSGPRNWKFQVTSHRLCTFSPSPLIVGSQAKDGHPFLVPRHAGAMDWSGSAPPDCPGGKCWRKPWCHKWWTTPTTPICLWYHSDVSCDLESRWSHPSCHAHWCGYTSPVTSSGFRCPRASCSSWCLGEPIGSRWAHHSPLNLGLHGWHSFVYDHCVWLLHACGIRSDVNLSSVFSWA